MKIAIVIPALNEADTITQVVSDVSKYGTPIVVNDGSTDDTAERALAAGAVVVDHPKNLGYDGALQSGFERASELDMNIVVTFDADAQHDPTVLNDILSPIREGKAKLVIGTRSKTARLAELVFGWYTEKRFGVSDILCGLKAYQIELFDAHGCFDSSHSIGTELAIASLRLNVPFATVPVPIHPRLTGPARLGPAFNANLRIFRALLSAVIADIRTLFR